MRPELRPPGKTAVLGPGHAHPHHAFPGGGDRADSCRHTDRADLYPAACWRTWLSAMGGWRSAF